MYVLKDSNHYLIEIREILYLSYIYPIKTFPGVSDFVASQKLKSSPPSAILCNHYSCMSLGHCRTMCCIIRYQAMMQHLRVAFAIALHFTIAYCYFYFSSIKWYTKIDSFNWTKNCQVFYQRQGTFSDQSGISKLQYTKILCCMLSRLVLVLLVNIS